jgi:DDE superfamily endonuclease
MEDTLEVSHRPYSSTHVLVCIDETSKQQVKETRAPLPGQVGKPRRYDYEYERNGVSNLFMLFAPLEGWRHVKVTDRRTNVDFAHCLKDLVDRHFPQAQKIVLMSDNFNTHKPAALYEAFSPQEARRIVEKIAWHHTPKHGSWLNMAEIELSVLQRQCLDRRIPDQERLTREVAAWEHKRNQDAVQVNWRFTTEDARIKLKKLYPSF